MIDLVATGMTALPVVGQVLGAIWFVANAISVIETGKTVSENIQESAYGNKQENAYW